MAHMTQEKKNALAPKIKAVLDHYNVKGTLSVRHHSTLVCKVKTGGKIEGLKPATQISQHWVGESYDGVARDFMVELVEAMMVGNHDKSDVMSDYFDVGWYISIDIID